MPSRILREGINSSSKVNGLSLGAEVLYRRLMSVVDDYGRYYAAPGTLRGACWPTAPTKVTDEEVKAWLLELFGADLLVLYVTKGCDFLEIVKFDQRTRSDSKFPPPSEGKPSQMNGAGICPQSADNSPQSASTTRARTHTNNELRIASPSGAQTFSTVGRSEGAFDSWWALWSSSRGGMHRTLAEQAFAEHVPQALFLACMECTASYLTMPQDIAGYRPDNFLRAHGEDNFSKRYEAAPHRQKPGIADSIIDFKRQELLNAQRRAK